MTEDNLVSDTAGIAWQPHHVEHLLPLCDLLQAPLITLNPRTASVARECYPYERIIEISAPTNNDDALLLEPEVRNALAPYRVLLYSHLLFRKDLRLACGSLRNPPPRVVFCPHGFSEKRQTWSSIAAYQDVSVFYGDYGLEQLETWDVREHLEKFVLAGNYRRLYHVQHRTYFDDVVKRCGIVDGEKYSRTILYAPTWHDNLRSSSFADALVPLVRGLPDENRLIIKPHPLLERQIGERYNELLAEKPNVTFVRNTPLTFPILELADVYIGDMSSIAYDSLLFEVPMIFLNQTSGDVGDARGSKLFGCGSIVNPSDYGRIYDIVDEEIKASSAKDAYKRELYAKVYANKSLDQLRKELQTVTDGEPPHWMTA